MKFFEDKKNLLLIWVVVIILAACSSLVDRFSNSSFPDATIKVEEKTMSKPEPPPIVLHPIIRTFSPAVFVTGHPYLTIKQNFLLGFFAPGDSLEDSVYALLIISLGLIFLFRIKKLDLDRPFSSQLVIAFKWAGLCCLAFALVDYFRFVIINKHIMYQTGDTYHLEHFSLFTSIILWAGILLTWLYRILKKAEVLQNEQSLTI